MDNKEKLLELFNRTYRNCKHYKECGKDQHLLNEIGVLRGIAYCIGEIVGEENLFSVINFAEFSEMIDEQERLRN